MLMFHFYHITAKLISREVYTWYFIPAPLDQDSILHMEYSFLQYQFAEHPHSSYLSSMSLL